MAFEGTGKMGFSHVKIFRVILLALLLLPSLAMAASDSGVSATLADFTLPHYRKNNLQFVLYGERAVNLGAIITVYNPLIDVVVRDLPDVEVITILKGMKSPDSPKIDNLVPGRLYPLHTDYRLIRDFWRPIPHSQVLISSGSVVYDKNKRTMTGDGVVHYRSRELDIDGEGFDASQEAKFVHVRRNVRVVYRPYAKELKDEAKKLLNEKWNKIKAKNSR